MNKHSDKIQGSLEKLRGLRDELPKLGNSIMSSEKQELYPLDLVIMGIVKRSLSITTAIDQLVVNWNMTCARALLRMQIDTALRLSAFWLSNNPQEMADQVFHGQPINKMKDMNGKRMTDSHLASKLGENFDWIPRVYKYTCSYIHFSERHLFDSITNICDEDKTVSFFINDKDYKFPEESWLELVECASDCLEIVSHFMSKYHQERNKC